MNIENGFEEFFTKRHGELPVDTTSKEYADKSYLKHEMKKAWEVATKKLEGCVVVPVEPTESMYLAGVEARNNNGSTLDVWTAMVEAARGGK